ncbi:hypothetical protein APY03_1898 [Variovorax sp. WDL1]|nr:hypothetical protein APY03_1898 [Variovorax sp. WDL1]
MHGVQAFAPGQAEKRVRGADATAPMRIRNSVAAPGTTSRRCDATASMRQYHADDEPFSVREAAGPHESAC